MRVEFEKIDDKRVCLKIGDSTVYYFDAVMEGPKQLIMNNLYQAAHKIDRTPENDQVALDPDEVLAPIESLVKDLREALAPQCSASDPLGQTKLLNKGRSEDLAMHLRVTGIYLREAIKDADGTITEKEETTNES